MVQRGDGVLRLPAQAIELGGVLVGRADAFLASHPGSEDALHRIFTLKLATVREGEEPTRRRAERSEFTDAEWRLVNALADHPNRLLVTATSGTGETYAEVAHETVFQRWGKLHKWIVAERKFLAWKTELEAARRAWQATPEDSKTDALLMGLARWHRHKTGSRSASKICQPSTGISSLRARSAKTTPGPGRGACRPSFTCCWSVSSAGLLAGSTKRTSRRR
jgi:hypothetical protein